MKTRHFTLIFLSLCSFSLSLDAQTPAGGSTPSKSKTDLVNDIMVQADGGYKAEAARKVAVQTQQIDVIAAGLTSSSYNTRMNCIASLSSFPENQQKQALATALSKDIAWDEEFPGESHEGQESVCKQVANLLKSFGVNAAWRDLLNPTARKSIANQLVPPN